MNMSSGRVTKGIKQNVNAKFFDSDVNYIVRELTPLRNG